MRFQMAPVGLLLSKEKRIGTSSLQIMLLAQRLKKMPPMLWLPTVAKS